MNFVVSVQLTRAEWAGFFFFSSSGELLFFERRSGNIFVLVSGMSGFVPVFRSCGQLAHCCNMFKCFPIPEGLQKPREGCDGRTAVGSLHEEFLTRWEGRVEVLLWLFSPLSE